MAKRSKWHQYLSVRAETVSAAYSNGGGGGYGGGEFSKSAPWCNFGTSIVWLLQQSAVLKLFVKDTLYSEGPCIVHA